MADLHVPAATFGIQKGLKKKLSYIKYISAIAQQLEQLLSINIQTRDAQSVVFSQLTTAFSIPDDKVRDIPNLYKMLTFF
ncbi:hypothetical protein GDO86_009207 [Hymenochirus boettgeri]|uniref:Uncharacterized protein n=1 Tax=Hymenochirus boettgeri TaxID=247094 RepID=A0A8T2JK93_9PIPI|nr:hypothetical protein GDO86_009207 [Hymenochirus boettgeri]